MSKIGIYAAYSTYEEAKRLNPECDIFTNGEGLFRAIIDHVTSQFDNGWKLVRPIPQTKEVEWVNGDIVNTPDGEGCIVAEVYRDGYSYWIVQFKDNFHPFDNSELSKPESPEDREKREREENGQSLYELVQNLWCSVDSKYTAHPYDSPMVDSKTKEMYSMLAVAVEYRKGGE